MIVNVTCQQCHSDLRIAIDDYVPSDPPNFDTPQFRQKLVARGWAMPGPRCPACKPKDISDPVRRAFKDGFYQGVGLYNDPDTPRSIAANEEAWRRYKESK